MEFFLDIGTFNEWFVEYIRIPFQNVFVSDTSLLFDSFDR